MSALTQRIRRTLGEYSHSREFPDTHWEGVEALHFNLAQTVRVAGIESAGWYKYLSSTRPDMDGKDWRIVVPDEDAVATVVNCHSLLHDDVWTLATTVYSTDDIDLAKVEMVGSKDFWRRVHAWTVQTAKALASSRYDYSETIIEISKRALDGGRLYEFAEELKPVVTMACWRVFGSAPNWPDMHFGFSSAPLAQGSIGLTLLPIPEQRDYAIVAVHPKARNDWYYVREIVRHELIHVAIGMRPDEDHHGEYFRALARAAGLPEKYWK